MKSKKLWTILSSVLGVLLAVLFVGSNYAFENAGHINSYLGTSEIIVEKSDADANVDTEYYKSDYGALSAENLKKLRADAYEQVVNEAREGTVLLWNNDNALPLASSERKVTPFGYAAAHIVYKGSGAGNDPVEEEATLDLKEALEGENFQVNEVVWNMLSSQSIKATNPGNNLRDSADEPVMAEIEADLYDQTSWENDYNDVAIIVLSRYYGEGGDMCLSLTEEDGRHQLQLTKKERDMLQIVKDAKQAGKFKKVIVLINFVWQLELEELKTYDVDAALLIGTPGTTGLKGVAEILTGKTNPSGRLVDTYATSALSAPAMANAVRNTPDWENADEVLAQLDLENVNNGGRNKNLVQAKKVLVQQENIYIGYKYYETRYEDAILNRFNAKGPNGIFASKGNEWNYADEISYPFGHGLTYTTFSQEITDVKYDKDRDMYTVSVKVTNTGDTAGKYSVLVFAQTPYGEYEQENKVEKAAVNLVGFGKTKTALAPGASETVMVEVARYLLASYDANNAEGYIISEGTNYFAVGNDAHDALNNILAAKHASGMYDHEGNPVAGNVKCVYEFNSDFDSASYLSSQNTGIRVTNAFEDNDINYWMDDAHKITYLTRSDWNGTFPTQPAKVAASQKMIDDLNSFYPDKNSIYETYYKPESGPDVNSFNQGKSIGLNFVATRDFADYDDPMWDKFVDQLTIDEMTTLFKDQNGGTGVESIAIPDSHVTDGCIDPNGTYKTEYTDGKEIQTTCYTSQAILAGTFNRELIANRGRLIGEEKLYSGQVDNWGLGLNLHRTPFSGRNWEYVSEDPNTTSLVGYLLTGPMQARGLIASPKHFCGNDQEMSRIGVSTFYTEQSLREGSLRGFEGSLRFGGALGTMCSMSRQGLLYTCSERALLTQVLRNEWGFKGRVISDASAIFVYMQEYTAQLAAGTDQFCFAPAGDNGGFTRPGEQVTAYIEAGDGNMLQLLREATKHSVYALAHSSLTNGIGASSKVINVTPWWEAAIYTIDTVVAVLAAGSVIMLTLSKFVFNKKEQPEEA